MFFDPRTGRSAVKKERVHGIELSSNKAGRLLEWLAKLWQPVPIYILGTVAVTWPTPPTVFKLSNPIGQIISGKTVRVNLGLLNPREEPRHRPFGGFQNQVNEVRILGMIPGDSELVEQGKVL